MQPRRLVLASASPRRRELLTGLGLVFDVRPSDVDETVAANESPSAYVQRVAESKLQVGLASAGDAFVLASDTVVVLDHVILGKPSDAKDACAILSKLSGRQHDVRTAVALGRDGVALETRVVTTGVRFRALDADEIARYVATGECMDKAGSYGIQGLAGAFVAGIEGSYSNVVGLPVTETLELLVAHGAVEQWP
ncbi:MAG: septum formation inhibitor Maf [Sandaracinus sp.]|nr:septum formation inhibitor Maf [Sandaracinus sp.]MCB9611277.1 septum formation inhibitor Maf [Sandaracinus sp.]MCB9620338.1 septum formation inhibitor Maf [Sandaracinus sp.]MCB9624451.1 septum formation inhibitor Maf [Sandaracinus sp.]